MLGLIALAVAGVSLVLNIVGLAIPYWEAVEIQGNGLNNGLWKVCVLDVCATIPDILVTSEMEATRAFVILAMLVLAGAIVVALLKLIVMKDKAILPKVAGVLAIVAGGFMIVAAIIYAAKVQHTGYDLHAGFALTIVAGVGSFVAGGLFFADRGQ